MSPSLQIGFDFCETVYCTWGCYNPYWKKCMTDSTAPNVVIISFLKIAMVALMILALVQTQENAHPSLLRALHIWLESFCLQMSFKLKYSWFCVTRQYFHKSPHIEDHTKFCLFVQSWSAYNWVDAATWPRGSGESWRSGPLSKSGISLLLYFSMYLYLYLWDWYFCSWFISIFVFVFSSICFCTCNCHENQKISESWVSVKILD